MSLPSTERTSPQDIARAAAALGRFHDVVIAASKLVHDLALTDADLASLRWARGLLAMASGQATVSDMPSSQRLAADGTLAAAIRRAARPDGGSPDEALRQLSQGIDKCLKGDRGEAVTDTMLALREVFTLMSQLALQADVLSQGETPAPGPWAHSTTSSLS
jgi:hypothetical protein